MTTYDIIEYIPYENDEVVFTGTREECREWLQKNVRNEKKGVRGPYIDDLHIYSNDTPDLYELYKEGLSS